MILSIETAAEYCSVAIAENGKNIVLEELTVANSHAGSLTLLIQSALAKAQITIKNLSAVAVSSGPGSYTGLRIGAATAKGIAYANDIPLLAVPTLAAVAMGAVADFDAEKIENTLFLPMLDARRMEVYLAAYTHTGECLAQAQPFIITKEAFDAYLESHNLSHYSHIVLCGNGACKAENVITGSNIYFINNNCSSKSMSQIAFDLYQKSAFESTAYFEPNYLKPANITVAKAKEV
jgi:tRNA threonylcarbamoyladenosine biosynthesis protein TsaB